MKVSFKPAPLGLAILGVAALTGAAAPARAAESPTPPVTSIEGLVTAATDASAGSPATLTIHSPFTGVGDLVLTVNSSTHFRKANGDVDTPDEMPPSGLPAVQSPSPTWFVGLSAQATFDPSHVALNVSLSRPAPGLITGVVESVTLTPDFLLTLNVPGRGKLDLTLDPQTAVRLDGLPSTQDKLAAGDLVSALFWPTATVENEALRVDARTPPPLHFEGVVTGLLPSGGGTPTGFTAQRGSTPAVTFQESSSTQFSLDGKTATAGDLAVGDNVSVSYRTGSDGNDALTVVALSPKPKPISNPLRTGVAHPGGDSPNGGSTGSGNPGSNGNAPAEGDSDQGKVKPAAPLVFEGKLGSVAAAGTTFTVSRGTRTLTFTVSSNTVFQISDKPVTFASLHSGQTLTVFYQATGSVKQALKVLLH